MSPKRRIVIVAYFLLFWGAGVWVPYFPLYLSHLGYRGWEIGVVIGVQPALRWTSAIVWAYIADRWRIRHRMLVVSAFTGALFFIPLLWVREFTAVLGVLAAIGLLHGSLIPMLDATVIDHLPSLGGDYGRLRLWGSVSFVIGSFGSAPLVHYFSPAIVPLLLLIPSLGLAPAFMRLPREQLGHGEHFHAPWELLTPPLTAFLATAFLIQLSCGAFGGFFAIHTAGLGFSDAVPGITMGLAVTAEVGLLFWAQRLVAWITPGRLIVICLVMTSVRWALTAAVRDEAAVILLQLGHAFTFSAFHVAALALLGRLIPARSSTGGQALYGMVAFGVGGSAGVALAGVLIDRLGTAWVFGFEAAVAMLGLVPALQLYRLTRN